MEAFLEEVLECGVVGGLALISSCVAFVVARPAWVHAG